MKTESQLLRGAGPCDLEIRVRTPWGAGGESFEFVLHSPAEVAGFHHREVVGARIRNPEAFQRGVFAKLERLRKGLDIDSGTMRASSVRRDLESLGHDLFLEVFDGEMSRIYQDCRDRVRTLFLTSDEPWIPWEILHGGEGDDFFCSRFQMGRWLSGSTAPLLQKDCRNGLVFGGYGGLKGAASELDQLREFAGQLSGFDCVFSQSPTSADLSEYLEQYRFDLVHYAGHGQHEASRAAESRIELEDGPFRAQHLSPNWTARLCAARPFVFSNACQVGRLEHSLTALDGWAARWVRRFGCSAYLAPLWSVRDSEAARFTEVVYQQLRDGHTLGEAVLLGRRDLRRRNPNGLDWATYSVYGHPNMKVRFGDHESSIEEGSLSYDPLEFALGRGPSAAPPAQHSAEQAKLSFRSIPRNPTPTTPLGRTVREIEGPRGHNPEALYPNPKRLASPASSSPKLKGLVAGMIGVIVTILIAISLPWSWTEGPAPNTIADSTDLQASPDPGIDTNAVKTEEDTEKEDLAAAKKPDTARLKPIQPPPPTEPFKGQPVVPGKIAIVVVDSKTGQAHRNVADAVETIFFEADLDLDTFIPSPINTEWVSSLSRGDLSTLRGAQRAPWGAEWLLIATASLEPLPQSNPTIRGFRLSLRSKLIDTSVPSVLESLNESHTGIGATESTAIEQASQRCLAVLMERIRKVK